MAHTVGEWAQVLGVSIEGTCTDFPISEIAFDSRRIAFPKQTVFVALQTKGNDGHRYLQQAYDAGVRVFLVAQEATLPSLTLVCWLKVEDTLRSLQQMVKYHREQFEYPVIAITGSNGKTIIKEWLYQLLAQGHTIVRTPKSYNSQIGVPLSVWQMADFHDLAIFEAGISEPGEMIHLEQIIQPTIGIFSTIGPAHDEGFSSRKEKISEKLKLFHRSQTLIYCRDHESIHDVVEEELPAVVARITWGQHASADLRILSKEVSPRQTRILCTWKDADQSIVLPFDDEASLENAMHGVLLMLHLEYDWPVIQDRVRQLHHIPMRLELKQAQRNSLLIYDCYNSDVKSLEIALDFLDRHHSGRNRVLILSDIAQSGVPPQELYHHVAQQINTRQVDYLVGVGKDIGSQADSFSTIKSTFFDTTEQLLAAIASLPLQDAAILLKGARHFTFERVGEVLEQKRHATVFEINLNALAHNLKQYQQRIPSGVKTMAMVKAFSYGAGSYEIASVLAFHQVDYLAVAYTEEGVALRQANVQLPIMVINPDRENLHQLWQYDLEPEVYSLELLEELIHQAQGRPVSVHLKWDTGMHRLGLEANQLPEVMAQLQAHSNVRVKSQLSHLVGSDNPAHDAFTHAQAEQFVQLASAVEEQLPYRPLRHLVNSGGIARFPEYVFDMVRLGLGLYGLDTTAELQSQLQPIGRLKTVISQLKKVPAGESIGYDRAVVVERDTLLATVAIGYADGYRRSFSKGKGYMLIKGQQAPTLGNVCMDLTMLDVTDIPGVHVGDEVIVFGPELPVEVLAKQADTIPYEIIAGIDQRVKRVYVEE